MQLYLISSKKYLISKKAVIAAANSHSIHLLYKPKSLKIPPANLLEDLRAESPDTELFAFINIEDAMQYANMQKNAKIYEKSAAYKANAIFTIQANDQALGTLFYETLKKKHPSIHETQIAEMPARFYRISIKSILAIDAVQIDNQATHSFVAQTKTRASCGIL